MRLAGIRWRCLIVVGKPHTSVIIPVRDGENFLEQAIISVLEQLRSSDEVIVVDNNSTDASYSIAAKFAPHVTLLKCATIGPSAARNQGLKRATGEHIAFLDHDDVWPAGRHRALLDALDKDPSVDAAAGRIVVRYEGSGPQRSFAHLDGRIVPEVLLWSSLFRRRIIDRVGYFAEEYRLQEDLEYALRLREAGIRYARCDADALIYRRHDRNATHDVARVRQGLLDAVRLNLARKRSRSPT
jgi:glycosyltransferase involved in cell wall biosynthesis